MHDHVDDSRITSTTDEIRGHFCEAWRLQFGEPVETIPITEDFTGLRHHCEGALTVISCDGVLKRLKETLKAFPLLPSERAHIPLPITALRELHEGRGIDKREPQLLEAAQQINGIIGFVTGAVRPEGHFAHTVLCRC